MPTNAETIDQTRSIMFANNLKLVPQVEKSILEPCVNSLGNFTPSNGKMFTSDWRERTKPQAKEGRAPQTPDKFAKHKRRVGFLTTYHDAEWLDTEDKLNHVYDPSSSTMMALAAGREQSKDDHIMALFMAAAREGETGENIIAFPSANIQSVQENTFYKGKADGLAAPSAADLPLTPAKIRMAANKLNKSLVKGKKFLAVSEDDLSLMLTSNELTSVDYNNVKALVDGEISYWLGFNWVRLPDENFQTDSSGNRLLPAWVQDAIEYKYTDIIGARVRVRPDRSDTPQAYYEYQDGGMRVHDNGVNIIPVKTN